MSGEGVTVVRTDDLLRDWRDGEEHGWDVEFAWLDEHHGHRIDRLASSIQTDGIRKPILLGSDGRVWDGHHRIRVAVLLALPEVPVIHAGPLADVDPGDPCRRCFRDPARLTEVIERPEGRSGVSGSPQSDAGGEVGSECGGESVGPSDRRNEGEQ